MKRWYVLRSKPRKEAWAAAMLERGDIEVYLPQISGNRDRGKPAAFAPLFPNYLFAHLDAGEGELQMARYSHGVMYIVSYGDEPCAVPDELVSLIRERVGRVQLRGHSAFDPGDRVVIAGGPLMGTEAIFDRQLSGAGRAHVLIQILHRLCRVNVCVGHLRLFQKAAGASRAQI